MLTLNTLVFISEVVTDLRWFSDYSVASKREFTVSKKVSTLRFGLKA